MCRFLGRRLVMAVPRVRAGVGEAPRHEVAGGWAQVVQRALWGLRLRAASAGGRARRLCRDARGGRGGCADLQRLIEPISRAFECRRGGVRTSAIVAGPRQAVFALIDDAWTTMPAHDVSTLITFGDAQCLGSHPRAKISMMRIREPQQGHGPGNT